MDKGDSRAHDGDTKFAGALLACPAKSTTNIAGSHSLVFDDDVSFDSSDLLRPLRPLDKERLWTLGEGVSTSKVSTVCLVREELCLLFTIEQCERVFETIFSGPGCMEHIDWVRSVVHLESVDAVVARTANSLLDGVRFEGGSLARPNIPEVLPRLEYSFFMAVRLLRVELETICTR